MDFENNELTINDLQNQIIENNRKISQLLSENENILRRMGYNPPATNMVLHHTDRIIIPSKYIRPKRFWVEKYRLNDFFSNSELASNIAYALMLSDLYNFILNRFNIWGPMKTMLSKAAIINHVCIIESFVGQVFDDMHKVCGKCDQHKHCEYFMPRGNSFIKKIDALEKKGILKLTPSQYDQIRNAYHLRNHLHFYTVAKENEYTKKSFTVDLHNDIVNTLQIVAASLYNDMLPATKGCYKDTLKS